MKTVFENAGFNIMVEELATIIAKEKLFNYQPSALQDRRLFEEAFKAYGDSAGYTHLEYDLTYRPILIKATVEMVDVQTDGSTITMTPKITAINASSLDTEIVDHLFCHMLTRTLRRTASLPLED